MMGQNLLLGALALQLGLVSVEQLLSAFRSWVEDCVEDFEDVLRNECHLGQDALEAVLETRRIYLEYRWQDPLEVLRNLNLDLRLLDGLRCIDDPEVARCLAAITAPPLVDFSSTEFRHAATQPATHPRFERMRLHEEGSLGRVFVARDRELGREVALKEIQTVYAQNRELQSRFALEAQVTGQLEHPGVVPVYSLWNDTSGAPCYAMRLIRGMDLETAIGDFYRRKDDLSPSERNREFRGLLQRFITVCHTMDYAHSRGVLHRDIKPSNIMLGKHGETLVVDWGVAKVRQSEDPFHPGSEGFVTPPALAEVAESRPGDTAGTLPFESPEQVSGQVDQLTPRSDVYSLGATLYCILTGRESPYDHLRDQDLSLEEAKVIVCSGAYPSCREVNPDVSPALEEICQKAMALKQADRYASAGELAEALDAWLADQPVASHLSQIKELEERIKDSPEVIEYVQALARCHNEVGLISNGMGRSEEAEAALRKALRAYEHVTEERPDKAAAVVDLTACRTNLARVLKAAGRDEEARRVLKEVLMDYDRLSHLPTSGYEALPLFETGVLWKEIGQQIDEAPAAFRSTTGGTEDEIERSGTSVGSSPSWLLDTDEGRDTADLSESPRLESMGRLRGEARFTILRQVGRGGMGVAYEARDEYLNREVVLKIMKSPGDTALARFVREARVASRLEHPGVVDVYGLYHDPEANVSFIALPLLRGRSFKDEIQRYHARGRRNAHLARLLQALVEVCEAVQHAHTRGIIHQDLKPANIMMTEDGYVRVMDWGACAIRGEEELEASLTSLSPNISFTDVTYGDLLGTPAYMAPEQFLHGPCAVDARTDIYVLGVVLYETLTGQLPFEAIRRRTAPTLKEIARLHAKGFPSPRHLDAAVDPTLDAICAKATHKDPGKRYQTAKRFAADIETWLRAHPSDEHPQEALPVDVREAGPFGRMAQFVSRRLRRGG